MAGLLRVFPPASALAAALSLLGGVAQAASPPPSAYVYELDKPHTQILFSVSLFGFLRCSGKFLDYKGTISIDRNHPDKVSVEATIVTASVAMDDAAWTDAVKTLFHPDQFPLMTFKSASVTVLSKTSADFNGTLTLLGVSRPVTLHVICNKADRNPFGKCVAGLSATADIKRSDFGMRDFITPAGAVVSDEVHIVIEVEANRYDKPSQGQFNH